MSRLTEALDRIGNYLQQHAPEVFAALQPGLSYEEIEEIVKDLPFRLQPEVYELYQWRNGTEYGGYGHLFIKGDCDYFWYSLEDAVKNYRKWSGLYYSTRAFQIFFAVPEGSGYILIEPEKRTCGVIFQIRYDPVDNFIDYHYTSLTNMMLTIAECYETGAYKEDREQLIDLGNLGLETTKIWWKYNYDIKDFLLEKLQKISPWISLPSEWEYSLVMFKDSRAVDILIQRLQTTASETTDAKESSTIRQEAAMILGEIGDVKAVEPLIRALQDECEYVIFYTVVSLVRLKDKRAIKPLIHALEKDTYEEHFPSEIAWALAELRAVEPLIEILHHKNKNVRLLAAWALGEIGDKRAIAPLSRLLGDGDSDVREIVIKALEAIDTASSQIAQREETPKSDIFQKFPISPITPISPISPIAPISPITPISPIAPISPITF